MSATCVCFPDDKAGVSRKSGLPAPRKKYNVLFNNVARRGFQTRLFKNHGQYCRIGVRGMKLGRNQKVISLLVAESEELTVLTATENGFGKRTPIGEYTRHGRDTQGMIAIKTSQRNGKVVAARLVRQDDEIMLITTGGVLIRTRVKEVREMSRATQGVTD